MELYVTIETGGKRLDTTLHPPPTGVETYQLDRYAARRVPKDYSYAIKHLAHLIPHLDAAMLGKNFVLELSVDGCYIRISNQAFQSLRLALDFHDRAVVPIK